MEASDENLARMRSLFMPRATNIGWQSDAPMRKFGVFAALTVALLPSGGCKLEPSISRRSADQIRSTVDEGDEPSLDSVKCPSTIAASPRRPTQRGPDGLPTIGGIAYE